MTAAQTGAVIPMMAEIGRVYYASKRRICYAQVVKNSIDVDGRIFDDFSGHRLFG